MNNPSTSKAVSLGHFADLQTSYMQNVNHLIAMHISAQLVEKYGLDALPLTMVAKAVRGKFRADTAVCIPDRLNSPWLAACC